MGIIAKFSERLQIALLSRGWSVMKRMRKDVKI